MFYQQYNNKEGVPSQNLSINKESTESELGEYLVQMTNHNYPQIQQPYQQQYSFQLQNTQIINPEIINPQIQNVQQGTAYPQHHIIAPQNSNINDDPQLYHSGQNRVFTLSIVTLWLLQILMEFLFLIKSGGTFDKWKLYSCPITAFLIFIYTVKKNHPNNATNPVSFIDRLLFIIYFVADIFTNIAILVFFHSFFLAFFLMTFRFCQFGNLICSMSTLVQTNRQLQMKGIIIATFIMTIILLLFVCACMPWLKYPAFYIFPIGWQIIQLILTFKLLRVINDIYNKKNKKIDINNIFTGFMLFKYSYYIPQ